MAYKLKVAGRTTGVSDNKTGLSIGLRLPFGEDGKVSECVTDASFLVQGEVWLTLEKPLPGEDGDLVVVGTATHGGKIYCARRSASKIHIANR